MRYALIGCGRISPNHIVAAKDNDLEMVAICDIVEKNMMLNENMQSLINNLSDIKIKETVL